MRIAPVLLFAAFGCSLAHASFDLMYLPDTNTGRVVRFDPVNAIGLGSIGGFGQGSAASKYASVMSATKIAYATSLGLQVMNPNTGDVCVAQGTPNGYSRSTGDGSGLLEAFSTSLYRYDGSTFGSTSVVTGSPVRAVFGPNYATSVALTVTGGDLVANRYTNMSLAGSTTLLTAASFTDFTFGASGGKLIGLGSVWREVIPYQVAGTHRLLTMSLNLSSGAISATVLSAGLTNFSASARLTYMPAHTGYYVVGDDVSSATTTRIMYFSEGGNILSSYTTTAVDVPTSNWGGSIFLAPEPSALSALALASLVLLRRRK